MELIEDETQPNLNLGSAFSRCCLSEPVFCRTSTQLHIPPLSRSCSNTHQVSQMRKGNEGKSRTKQLCTSTGSAEVQICSVFYIPHCTKTQPLNENLPMSGEKTANGKPDEPKSLHTPFPLTDADTGVKQLLDSSFGGISII